MFSPSPAEVFTRAFVLAHDAGLSEIGIETLLAAIDGPTLAQANPPDVPESGSYGFFVNSDWIPLFAEVAKAIAPLGSFENIGLETLRSALLSAKKNAAEDSSETL